MSVDIELVLLAAIALREIGSGIFTFVANRRRAAGRGLDKAFRNVGGAIESLHRLYRELQGTEGFHSIRLISSHNSGAELSTPMNWKGTVVSTMPHDDKHAYRWNEQPLDPEYLTRVLRPVVAEGRKCVRLNELNPDGSLGSAYRRLGIKQSLIFLVSKTNHEIVYASVSFTIAGETTPEQNDAIRVCESEIAFKLKR